MTVNELFAKVGTEDISALISRFGGNEGLLVRFVKKFPSDLSIVQLKEAIEKKDYDMIEMSAHTLKGVAANLGFERLSAGSSKIVNAVRKGTYESIEDDFAGLLQEYSEIAGYIEQLD